MHWRILCFYLETANLTNYFCFNWTNQATIAKSMDSILQICPETLMHCIVMPIFNPNYNPVNFFRMSLNATFIQKRIVSIVGLLLPAVAMVAQALQVTGGNTPPFTPQNLISNIFLGDGVEVTNITYTGNGSSVGYFTGGTTSVGIDRGLIMTSGRAETQGLGFGAAETGNTFANNPSGIMVQDADLASLTTPGFQLFDLCRYEITFIPVSDTLRFRYCFASEEYPEYSCTAFNDVFGFFIQGPGYPVPTNIAIIPGTNLSVAINNLHPPNPPICLAGFNDQFYNNNNFSNNQPTYDGFTDVFTAEAVVVPCQEYTIKLVIADVSDDAFDSGVFLEAKSFGTGSLDVEVNTVSADGTVTEGCTEGAIRISLPNALQQNYPLDYTVWGTATNGTDIQTIPANLFIPSGQTEIVIPIIALEDNLAEGSEFIALDIQRDPCNRDTVYVYLRDNGLLPPNLRPDTTICQGAVLELDATVPIPLPTPPSFTNPTDYAIPTIPPGSGIAPLQAAINVFGVLPVTLGPDMIRSVCVNITHNWDDDIDLYLISPGGQFIELSTDNGANGDNYTNTCFSPGATTLISSPGPFAPASAAPFTGSWLPEGPWEDLWDGDYPSNGQWTLQVRDDANGFIGTLNDWTITFEPGYKVQYTWAPTANLDCPFCPVTNADPQTSTVYQVTATDSYGCTVTDSVSITVLEALAAPAISCLNTTANSITFGWNAVPNATAYEVNINGAGWGPANGLTSHLVTGLVPNTSVTIEVRGINAAIICPSVIGTATCVNCERPTAALQVVDATCFGSATGSIVVTPDGANPPYTYSTGALNNITGVFPNLVTGNYSITVTDAGGCSATFDTSVLSPPAIMTSLAGLNVSCFGFSNGQITVDANGGAGAYTYQWSDPAAQITQTAANLAAGSYTVTITDANACTHTATGTLTEPPPITINLAAMPANCFNTATGSITATAGGGAGSYSFIWNNMAQTAQNNNLILGNYTVTVTDQNGCTNSATASVGEPSELSAQVSVVNLSCPGSADGSATVIVTGGTLPYAYNWNTNPIQTNATASNLEAQAYQVTITDGQGCTLIRTAQPTAPEPIVLSMQPVDNPCFGGQAGSIFVTATGGTGNFSYLWSDPLGQTSPGALNLPAGLFTVTVTDALNCTASASAQVLEAAPIQVNANVVDADCFGAATGSITVSQTGGVAPFSYSWSSGESGLSIVNKTAGTYTVTLSDALGCTATLSRTIGEPNGLSVIESPVMVRCFGESTGSITLQISGGSGNYQVAWSGTSGFTATGTVIQDLPAGVYSATVTDLQGCSRTLAVNIVQPAASLVASLPDTSDVLCFQATNGIVSVAVNGGTPPYAYSWNNGQNTPTLSGLGATALSVTITDANGCETTAQTKVVQKDQLFAVGDFTNPRCFNGADGSARLSAVFYGATAADPAAFVYQWSTSPVQNTPVAVSLQAGQTYTVTITDPDGCSAATTITIGNPFPVEAVIRDKQDVGCHGDNTGQALVAGSGGTGPYTFLWSPGPSNQQDSLARNLSAGVYRVTVTDALGCPDIATVTITQATPIRTNLESVAVLCFGESTGSAAVQATGGTPAYTYQWSTGASGPELANVPAGIYFMTVTDANACVKIDSVRIQQPPAVLSATAGAVDPSCFDGRDGSITIVASGGVPPYRYALDQNDWNGSTVQIGLKAGTYTPQVIDQNGCVLALPPLTVEQPDPLLVDLGPDLSIVLGDNTQLITSVTGAVDPLTYSWDTNDAPWLSCLDCPNPFVDSLYFAQDFTVTVTDDLGCKGEDQIRISLEKPRRIYVPSGFTPNGDKNNDVLMVHGQASATILYFRIYNRWGELYFEASNFKPNDERYGWNGQFRGKDAPSGTYVWTLEVQYLDGLKENLTGNSTLIR